MKLKGGRGVATGLGVIFGIDMIVGVISVGIFGLILFCFRFVSLASIFAVSSIPVAYHLLNQAVSLKQCMPIFIFLLVMAILVIIRHKSNIIRIFQGREPRAWKKRFLF